MDLGKGGPALVGANWYQFRENEQITHSHVASVSFVWVVRGSGVISSGGKSFKMSENSILRLPWFHQIEYAPEKTAPFYLGTIHLIPWHSYSVTLEPRVAFRPHDPLLHAVWRSDTEEVTKASFMNAQVNSARNFISLATYGIERFLTNRTDEASLRALGNLLMEENRNWSNSSNLATNFPIALEAMMEKILSNLDKNFTVDEIAKTGNCSPATARRLFLKYTGQSVIAWSRRKRMLEAATLLKTSGMRVNEIARRLGYEDPLYFSRTFSKFHGVPPTSFEKKYFKP